MCDFQDALNREVSRDISIFETASIEELDGKQVPRVALDLAVKKYMRSAADRTFSADEVRTPEAIERTIDYLITQVLGAEVCVYRDLHLPPRSFTRCAARPRIAGIGYHEGFH
jgi:hypothetical protein